MHLCLIFPLYPLSTVCLLEDFIFIFKSSIFKNFQLSWSSAITQLQLQIPCDLGAILHIPSACQETYPSVPLEAGQLQILRELWNLVPALWPAIWECCPIETHQEICLIRIPDTGPLILSNWGSSGWAVPILAPLIHSPGVVLLARDLECSWRQANRFQSQLWKLKQHI